MGSELADSHQSVRDVLAPANLIPLLGRCGIPELEAAPIAYGLDSMLESAPRKYAWYQSPFGLAISRLHQPISRSFNSDASAALVALVLGLRNEKLQIRALQDLPGGYMVQAEIPPSIWANTEPGYLLLKIQWQPPHNTLVTAELTFLTIGLSHGRGKRFVKRVFDAVDSYVLCLA